MKERLGWQSTRQRSRRSVLRAAPCLMGCFSVVSLIYAAHARGKRRAPVRQTLCHHKTEPTFSDALFTVRKMLWETTILEQTLGARIVAKCPPKLKTFILGHF